MTLRQRYQLETSSIQIRLFASGYLLALAALWIYLEPGWFRYAAVLLAGLFACCDLHQLTRSGARVLDIDTKQAVLALESDGQPHFYAKNKVYACRWFAILKLMNQHHSRTLILHSDSLASPEIYRQLRHALTVLERKHAA